jgi:hypothetical protein
VAFWHKNKYRIVFDSHYQMYHAEKDYGLLMRDWSFLRLFKTQKEAEDYIVQQKAKASNTRYDLVKEM